nr:phospholipase C-like protein [Bodo saltans]
MDRGGTALFYTPSEKPLVNRLISFKHMTCINVEVKDVMSIDNEVRRVELRIESNGPFKKPLRLSMMEKDGILVAQVAARRVGYHSEHITKNAFQRRLREVWLLGDADRSGSISLQELVELLKRLNVKVSPAEVEERFAQVDTDHSNSLEFHEFVHLFRGLTTIRCLSELFRYFAADHRHEEIEGDAAAEDEEEQAAKQPPKLLFANGLVRFFREAQGEIVPEEIADGIIELYAGGRNSTKKNEEYDGLEETNPSVTTAPNVGAVGMTLHAFSLLMVDTVRNSWFDGDHDRVFQSMDEPLHHYRIACSHNTYSSGSQFSSQSKTEMYHRVLRQQGCRCVEIDCHNGARLPMVYHHYTPTSEISFEDVVDAIKESAFVSSPFPVVLSLEVHTDARQTMIIAHTLMSKLGTALLYPEELQSYGGPLPFTPNALQYRILVKWKGSPDDIIAQQQHPTPPSSQQHFDPNDQAHAARTLLGFRSCRAKLDGNSLLRSLITVGGVHSKDGVNCKPSDIQSTSEGDMIKMVGKSFQLKNTRMMTRGYPAGSRMMDSTNLDPMVPWSNGVQMVAMNYQTWDEPMHLHEGMFRVNGRCGYLLKPLSLRTAERVEDMWLGTTMPKSMVLTVRVLFGYQLSHLKADVDTLNTLVEVSVRECPQTLNAAASPFTSPNAMHEDSSFAASLRSPSTVTSVGSGCGNDHASAFEPAGTFEALRSPASRSSTTPITFSQHKAPKSLSLSKTRVITKKTSVVRKEGFLPYWDEVFTFPILDVELAMLSIHVKDKELTTDKSVGYGCVPLSSLMLGYRAVSLLSPQGEPLYGSAVVCHFSLSV